MAIFAQLDSNNLVTDLIVVADAEAVDEQSGINFCQSFCGGGDFVQTFQDASKRRKYASVGDYYDLPTDAFYRGDITQNNTTPSRYINLPNNTSYCITFRSASSTFTGLIATTYFGKNTGNNQSVVNLVGIPITSTPVGTPYVIIRDPVDRFVSSYALQTGGVPCWLPVDQFIAWLVQQDKIKLNPHFMPQVNLIGIPAPSNIVYFDFAKDLTPMAVALGLPTPLPSVNATDTSKKPTLTADQIATLQNFYADDVALYAKVSAQ
jgi:hypothetical protein